MYIDDLLLIHAGQVLLMSSHVSGPPGTVDQSPAAVYVDHCPGVAERLTVQSLAGFVARTLGVAQHYLTVQAGVTVGR